MINFKKGPALSLNQVNYTGPVATSPVQNIVAGMVVQINSSGAVIKPTIADAAADKALLLGFAINNQLDGDVVEAGALGVYALDGASVVETDQYVAGTIASFVPGALVGVETLTGKIKVVTPANAAAGYRVIGQVEAVRALLGVTQVINGVSVQGSITVVGVKLAS